MKFMPLLVILIAMIAFTIVGLAAVSNWDDKGKVNLTMTDDMNNSQETAMENVSIMSNMMAEAIFFMAVMVVISAGIILWGRLH